MKIGILLPFVDLSLPSKTVSSSTPHQKQSKYQEKLSFLQNEKKQVQIYQTKLNNMKIKNKIVELRTWVASQEALNL